MPACLFALSDAAQLTNNQQGNPLKAALQQSLLIDDATKGFLL